MDSMDNIVFTKNPKTHRELFGVDIKHFANLTYMGAIKEKVRLLKQRIKELKYYSFEDTNEYEAWQTEEELERLLHKALQFNETIMKEYEKEIK